MELIGVRRTQGTAAVVTLEEILHFLEKLIFRAIDLCYTGHGMSLYRMFLGYLNYTKWMSLMLFYLPRRLIFQWLQRIIYLRSLSK